MRRVRDVRRGAAEGWGRWRRLRGPALQSRRTPLARARPHASRDPRTMFHCIVQPRHDWGPPDLTNAHPGTNTTHHIPLLTPPNSTYTMEAGTHTKTSRLTTQQEHRYDLLMAQKRSLGVKCQ